MHIDLNLGWGITAILCNLVLLVLTILPYIYVNKNISSINSKAKEANLIPLLLYSFFAIILFTSFTMFIYNPLNFMLQDNPFSLLLSILEKQQTFLSFRIFLFLFSFYVFYDSVFLLKKIFNKSRKVNEKKTNLRFKRLCVNTIIFFSLLALNVFHTKNPEYSQLIGNSLFIFGLLSMFFPKKNKMFIHFKVIVLFVFSITISVLLVNWKLGILITIFSLISIYMFFTINFSNVLNRHRINWI